MKKDLLEKIKKRGYWRINFQPLVDMGKFKSLEDCKKIVEKNSVKLRGISYPFVPLNNDDSSGLEPGNNFYQGWIDAGCYKAFWRMYQSGQFIHYLALREDWFDEDLWRKELSQKIKPLTSLGIIGSVVYQMTEVFMFLSRLTNDNVYDEGVSVSVSLNNTENRKLWIEDDMRVPFMQEHKTASEKIEYPSREFTKEQIISDYQNLSLDVIKYIFDRFGWHEQPIEAFKKDQDNLLSGRI